MSEAVMSRTSLCLIDEYPPVGHDKACSTLKVCPQLRCEGELAKDQSYRKDRAALKADFWSVNPYLSIGSADSHTEAPFSCEIPYSVEGKVVTGFARF